MRFIFENELEAEDFLDSLKKYVSDYGCISIMRAMWLAGSGNEDIFSPHINAYGWKDLENVTVVIESSRYGGCHAYVVELPEEVELYASA